MLLAAALAFAAAITADCWTTAVALRRGGIREANPIMAATGHPVLASAIVAALYLAGALWAAAVAAPPARAIAIGSLFALAAWRGAAGVWNYRQIRKGEK
jgi:hypothetical protein